MSDCIHYRCKDGNIILTKLGVVMRTKIILTLLAVLALIIPASAHFDDSWDWHNVTDANGTSQYKTTVHYCFDASVNDTWKGWINSAIQNWNDAGTGWTLAEGPPCQVTIKVEDIKFRSGGAYVSGYGSADANGRISNLTMVFDSNLSDQKWGGKAPDGWGRTGNNSLDPVVVAGHELGHVLRLKHSGAGVDTGDLEDPVTPGNHNQNLSESDKNESRNGTVTRGASIRHGNFDQSGGDMKFGGIGIIMKEGTLYEATTVSIRPLSHMSTPWPVNVPAGTDAIINAVDIRSRLAGEMLEVPATVTITYSADDLAGKYFVGDMQVATLGTVDESSLKAFIYDLETEQWSEIAGSIVDTDARTVSFDTTQLGILGLGASVMEDLDTLVVVGKVVEITHSDAIGLSTVLVEDKNGDMQTVTIPFSEGKDLIVGDEVEITVMTIGEENVYTAGDLLEGTIVDIQNVISEGTAGTTIITIKGADGLEYKISVPFAEGNLVNVGDDIKVPVTGLDGDELVGEGTMNPDGMNIIEGAGDLTEPTEVKGKVSGIRHSGSSSVLTLLDDAGNEHVVTVPLSEGEKIKLGVKVSVKVIKSADGTIESIDVTETDETPGFGVMLAVGALALVSLLRRRK